MSQSVSLAEILVDEVVNNLYEGYLESGSSEGRDALVIAHPGCYLDTDEELPDDITLQGYAKYDRELGARLESSNEDTDVYVFYENKHREYAEKFLGDRMRFVDEMIPTSTISALPVERKSDLYSQIFTGLDDESAVEFWGEFNGMCTEGLVNNAKKISEKYIRDINIKEGVFFPKDKLERTAGTIHWQGEPSGSLNDYSDWNKFN